MVTDLALMTYMATMSVTPGPNNVMLAASGVNFGFRRTVPHMFGIAAGLGALLGGMALLMVWVMMWLDALRPLLVVAGCTYLLWLAWRQARAGEPGAGQAARPLGFFGAALFQWVNPKAWMMALNTVLLFLPKGQGIEAVLSLVLMCMLVNLPCIALWVVAGDRLRHRLRDPSALRLFNRGMALLLAATALWIALDELGG